MCLIVRLVGIAGRVNKRNLSHSLNNNGACKWSSRCDMHTPMENIASVAQKNVLCFRMVIITSQQIRPGIFFLSSTIHCYKSQNVHGAALVDSNDCCARIMRRLHKCGEEGEGWPTLRRNQHWTAAEAGIRAAQERYGHWNSENGFAQIQISISLRNALNNVEQLSFEGISKSSFKSTSI